MSKATGVKGYTPKRLRRSQEAAARYAAHAQRSVDEQVSLLDTRPGNAARERARLAWRLIEENGDDL